MSQLYAFAKRGPSSDNFKTAKNEVTMTTGLSKLHNRWVASGGLGLNQIKAMQTTSADIRLSKTMMAKISNASATEQQIEHWRVSIGASAHRVEVNYAPNSNVPGHIHSWGIFGHRKNAAAELGSCYQGSRVVGAGAAGAHYNSKELENQCYVLMDKIRFEDGAECNTVSTWHRIWYNVAQITLGELRQDGFNRPHWAARPVNPTSYNHMITGLNQYNAVSTDLIIGQELMVELDTPEVDLIPYIDYLLGAGPDTFNWRWGNSGGNRREPHLTQKTPVGINYGYIIRDNLNAAPAAIPVDPALPGLPAAVPVPPDTVVGNWNQDLLDRAIAVLARSMPIASDIEAGCIKAAIDVFAEPFRGVNIAEVCGADQNNAGNNAFLDQGTVRIPRGSHVCCMATRITDKSEATRAAQSRAQQAMDLMRSMEGIRGLAETHILPLQLSCRQLGLTAVLAFPALPLANMNIAAVPAVNVTAASRGGVLNNLVGATSGEPSQLLLTTSMMMEVIYGAVLPESAMYFDFGNRSAEADFPLWGEANIGECLTSVHAAQVADNMLQQEAIGLAGIPNEMTKLAAEARVIFGGVSKPVIDGESGSTVDEGEADALPGKHMLGHAILFLRDDNLQDDDVFEVEVAGFKRKTDPVGQLRAQGVTLTLPARMAFSQDATFNDDLVHNRVMSLFADFDVQRFSDLRLSLPNSTTVNAYAASSDARARVPGFVAAMIMNSLNIMTGNIGLTLVQRSTKRSRITAPNHPEVNNAQNDEE